jgi:hypothetical protein
MWKPVEQLKMKARSHFKEGPYSGLFDDRKGHTEVIRRTILT